MATTKLSDLTIAELRACLQATEQSVGRTSVSARLIRRELDRKLREARAEKGGSDATPS